MAGEMQRVLADLIRQELSDPRLGMVSITEVKLSRDLAHARVYVSALEMAGSDAVTSCEVLQGAAGLLRHEMGRRIKFRVLPKLEFIADETERKAVEIEATIRQARSADQAAAKRRGEDEA